ncbi:MAG: uroporphyrinogen-III synthase [Rikenellaceae bacterium]|nr:uroporphyrinogen-III synthase [Rikenellaceae bacterium]
MSIKKILVSQPKPAIVEKSPYYEIHTKYGAEIDYRPFIRVEGVSLKEYRSQRIDILSHTAIVFTSRTTVDHFFRICEESRITVPETMKYLCNTEAVALYLQKYIVYRKRKISFADGTFNNLMELILKHKNEKLLLILSEPHKPELPLTMEKLKLDFHQLILSRTVSCDLSDLKLDKYDLLAFFSPSEIASLTEQFGTAGLPRIATFGNGTAKAAVDAGLTVNVSAPTPQAPSMAKAIDIYIKRTDAGEDVPPVEIVSSNKSEEFLKAQESKPKKQKSVNGKPTGVPDGRPGTPGKEEAGLKTPAVAAPRSGKSAS